MPLRPKSRGAVPSIPRAPRAPLAVPTAGPRAPRRAPLRRRSDPGSSALQFLIWYLRLNGAWTVIGVVATVGALLFGAAPAEVARAAPLRLGLGVLTALGWAATYFWVAQLFAERRPIAGRIAAVVIGLSLLFAVIGTFDVIALVVAVIGIGLLASVWKELDGTPIDE